MHCVYKIMPSPVGELTLVARGEALAAILWQDDKPTRVRLGELREDGTHPVLLQTQQQLREYFAGTRQQFEVPLDFAGTDFQKQVWQALLTIPFGQTRSYGEIARQIGRPAAVRAVGAANGKNPVSIIAPCHRVIGATGALTGFRGRPGGQADLAGAGRHRPVERAGGAKNGPGHAARPAGRPGAGQAVLAYSPSKASDSSQAAFHGLSCGWVANAFFRCGIGTRCTSCRPKARVTGFHR